MGQTIFFAPNQTYVERILGRKLDPLKERVSEGPDSLQGSAKGLTIVFMGDWKKGREDVANAIEAEAMIRQMAGAMVIDAPWDRPQQPSQQWGTPVTQMLARQAAKRLAQEMAWVDAMKLYGWEPQKPLTRWQKARRRVAGWFRDRRVALARWIAGDEW